MSALEKKKTKWNNFELIQINMYENMFVFVIKQSS